ncbi:MAG: cytochrome c-type biogenesis protein CcmH [Chloroflexota bacterium]|nr:cytochrome c-type biogenesis protein CcmH [Chloroflexota bacterium]
MALLLVLLALLIMPGAALAQSYASSAASSGIDDRALAIANALQCPVCQNVTVAYSQSELAGQMRQVIREKLQRGESRDQIIQYFVDRYGESILEQPPKHGLNLLVWLLPLVGLLTGLAVVGGVLRSRRAPAAQTASEPAQPLDDEDERLLSQALKELG